MNETAKQTVLRQLRYSVYALTVRHEGDEHATAVAWVSQASFDPPMVVVAVENTSRTIGLIRDAHHFAINVLHDGQRDLAEKLGGGGGGGGGGGSGGGGGGGGSGGGRGAASAAAAQKLKGIKTKPAPTSGAPVLADGLGWLECRAVATLPSGDHTLVLGEVVEAGVEHAGAKPLTLETAGLQYSG